MKKLKKVSMFLFAVVCMLAVAGACTVKHDIPDASNDIEYVCIQAENTVRGEDLEIGEGGEIDALEQDDNGNPYAELNITFQEKEMLARMAYNEARGESFEGQIAVVQVALNRHMHKAYGGTIESVLFSPHQFSVGATYTDEQMDAVEAALAGEPVLDLNTDVVYFSTGALRYGTYFKTIGNHIFRTYD